MENSCLEDQETIREFLVESYENLEQLDRDLIELEKNPRNAALLGGVFRTMHTIKGACGFLAFTRLEKISHDAETLLSQLRDGKRELNPNLVSLILETVDATRKVLACIETNGQEGDETFADLTARLRLAAESKCESECKPNPAKSNADAVPMAPPAIPAKEKDPAPLAPAVSEPGGRTDDSASIAKGDLEKSPGPVSAEEEGTRSHSAAETNIRVGVGLLDKLMDLVGELVLTRNQILQFNAEREDATLNSTSQRLNLITSELQEGVMKTRMQPIGVVWHSLPRVVRDMAFALGKQIQIKMDGSDTELDRTIIEAIKDPLIHLVRNSCDHGIELAEIRIAAGKPAQGTMALRAYHEGGQVSIEVADDGAGIDAARIRALAIEKGMLRPEQAAKLSEREALNLIFEPGFTTAKTVTNLSGRGVGMDVVKSNIEKIGGVVDVFSVPHEGTTVKIRIPLTLAIIPGLVITSGGERFVIPQVSLLELIRLEGDTSGKHIEHVHGTPVYRRRGSLLPVAYLSQILGLKPTGLSDVVSMVVLQAEDRQFGLVVDGINDTQEIVVKPLAKQLKGLTLYAGATIMGDGHVALILDVPGVGQRSGVLAESREGTRAAQERRSVGINQEQRLLLFRAGSFERVAVPLSLVARLEEFPHSAIEQAGGGQVVQYRNSILPLVSLGTLLEPGAAGRKEVSGRIQVVVFNDEDRAIGMVVDEILDVTEEVVAARQKSLRKGLLGSAVVGGRVTDFLDLNEVIRAARQHGVQGARGSEGSQTILLADPSALSRGIVRSALDMAGYDVIEASSVEEAMEKLEVLSAHLVITAPALPSKGISTLPELLRAGANGAKIPILALCESADQANSADLSRYGFTMCATKSDTTAIVEAAERLLRERAPEGPSSRPAGETR